MALLAEEDQDLAVISKEFSHGCFLVDEACTVCCTLSLRWDAEQHNQDTYGVAHRRSEKVVLNSILVFPRTSILHAKNHHTFSYQKRQKTQKHPNQRPSPFKWLVGTSKTLQFTEDMELLIPSIWCLQMMQTSGLNDSAGNRDKGHFYCIWTDSNCMTQCRWKR